MEHSYTSKHEARCDLTLVVRCQKCEQSKNEILKKSFSSNIFLFNPFFKNFFLSFLKSSSFPSTFLLLASRRIGVAILTFPGWDPSLSLSLSLTFSFTHALALTCTAHTHPPHVPPHVHAHARTLFLSLSSCLKSSNIFCGTSICIHVGSLSPRHKSFIDKLTLPHFFPFSLSISFFAFLVP